MTKTEAITTAKRLRVDADALLQRMKEHKKELVAQSQAGEAPIGDDVGEAIAHHVLSIRSLELAIMHQGMVLKNIGNPTPYPNSYDPTNTKVDPTADGLKL